MPLPDPAATPRIQTADRTAHFGGGGRPELLIGNRRRLAGFVIPPEGVDPIDYVFCPGGHHVDRNELERVQESVRYVCKFRDPPGDRPPCNLELLVLFVWRRSKDGQGCPIRKVWTAEVDWREFQYMESAGITDPFDMMAWLGEKYDPPRRPNRIDKRIARSAIGR